MTLPALLRVGFFAGLAAVGATVLRSPSADARGVLELENPDASVIADALLSRVPPARVRWATATLPDAQALWRLTPGPLVPPMTLPVGPLSALSISAPVRPTAGRNAALGIHMTGLPGDSTPVFVEDALGAADSMLLRFNADGRAEAGARVQPGGPGWQRWTVRAGSDSARVGAWAREARPLRVLAFGGTPDWESRFALRALEESGVEVDARFDLGRVSVGGGQPSNLDALNEFDVVVLMGEVPLGANAADGLRAFVASGGGVLVAPNIGAAPPANGTALSALLRGWGITDSLQVGALEAGGSPTWTLPPELSPLAAAPARVRTVTGSGPSGHVGARDADGHTVVALAAIGRGRVGFSGIAESWRWRMEAGDVEGHQAWWRDWVEWAAGGLGESLTLSVSTPEVPVGSRVDVSVGTVDSGATRPRTVELVRPDGTVESLRIEGPTGGDTGAGLQTGVAHFLAAAPGAYQIRALDVEAGVMAVDVGPSASPAQRSLAAIASGRPNNPGESVPVGGGNRGSSNGDEVVWSPAGGPFLPLWLGGLCALLLLVEWTLRRRRGGP